MSQMCAPEFEQSLLSGYVDGELTQADNQRVRVHLDHCDSCRQLVMEIRQIRQAASSTPFPVPTDEQWWEAPRSGGSRWLRRLGWTLVGLWLAGELWLVTRALIEGSASAFEKVAVAGLTGGVVLLFLSVLLDRLAVLRTDRYRRVQK